MKKIIDYDGLVANSNIICSAISALESIAYDRIRISGMTLDDINCQGRFKIVGLWRLGIVGKRRFRCTYFCSFS